MLLVLLLNLLINFILFESIRLIFNFLFKIIIKKIKNSKTYFYQYFVCPPLFVMIACIRSGIDEISCSVMLDSMFAHSFTVAF